MLVLESHRVRILVAILLVLAKGRTRAGRVAIWAVAERLS